MERCPSWSKEHDWKSCKPLKRLLGFESPSLRHVGAKLVLLRFSLQEKHPPASLLLLFRKKVTLGSPVRPKTPSRRLAVATNLLRVHACVGNEKDFSRNTGYFIWGNRCLFIIKIKHFPALDKTAFCLTP